MLSLCNVVSYFSGPYACGARWPPMTSTSFSGSPSRYSLYRPEFLLWRTAFWKCLELGNFWHMPSGTHNTIVPHLPRCSGAALWGSLSALRAASEQMQWGSCGTWAALLEARVNLHGPGQLPSQLAGGYALRTQQQLRGQRAASSRQQPWVTGE